MLFYVMGGFVVCLFIIMWLIWENVKLTNRIDEMEERINKLEDVVIALEHRTSFYMPTHKKHDYSEVMYPGHTCKNDSYIYVNKILHLLLKRLDIKIKRVEASQEEIILINNRKNKK